jgi:perosamine synthetase
LIPLSIPDLRGREIEYLTRCVEDNWVSSAGPFVTELEERMAAICNCSHGVATVNGTAALHLSLIGLGISPGDAVVVPDWTFAATANAVMHAGATPVLVDVNAENWTLDPQCLHRALAGEEGRIKAIVAVHALGHPADMDSILEIAAVHGVPVIEDAAGALGATYRGAPVGSFGAAAIFSFNGNKTVTAGSGGAIVTDDGVLADRMRHISTQARVSQDYRHDTVGYNYRMANINAAIAVAQLERMDEMIAAKRAIAARYDSAIRGRNDLEPMPRMNWAESCCWLYSVRTKSTEDADNLVDTLNEKGIQARKFWRSLSEQAPYAKSPTYANGVAGALGGRIVSLPCSSNLSQADQSIVIDALDAWTG